MYLASMRHYPPVAPHLTIVLPAHNEEATVGTVVRALRTHPEIQALPRARILVVDNASTDATARMAAEAGAEVVREPRRGYGAACLAGALAASPGATLLLMDADGSDDLAGAARVAHAILAGEADLAVGSRTRGQCDPGALTPQQRLGNAVAALVLRAGYGLRVSDLGPTRAIRRETLLRLEMRELGYGWSTEMLAKAARAGLRVHELPVDYHCRAGGRSKVAGTLRGTLRASAHILRTLARYRRWSPASPTIGAPALATAEPPRRVLAIVARVPVAGQTKTRLGAHLGHDTAAMLYAAFLCDLGARFTAWAGHDGFDLCWLYAAPTGHTESDFARWVPPGAVLLPQEGDDFAARLWQGTRALAARGYTQIVLIGSDSPHLPAERVRQAFAALDTSQVAIGPAMDGGYYLLAQRAQPAPVDLFTGIQMSTATVCAETLARAAALGLDTTLLPSTFDVDEVADLDTLRAALESAPTAEAAPSPATLAALRALPSISLHRDGERLAEESSARSRQ